MAYAVGKKNIKNCNEFLIRNGNFSLWLVTGDERFQVLGEFFTFYMLRSYQFGRAKGEYPKTLIIKTWKSGNADSFTLVLASLIIISMFKVSWGKIVKLKYQC